MKSILSWIKKNILNNYLLIIGFIIFSLFFWSRFLRLRTSKVLPLNLSVLSFFIILYICCIFSYILMSLIFSKRKNKIIEEVLEWIFTPIKNLEIFVRHLVIKILRPKKVLKTFWPILKFTVIETKLFYIIFWIFPRLLLLTALFLDIFIFHKFHYKYQVIFFGLLLLFNRCFKYTLKNIKEEKIKFLSADLDTILTKYEFGIHPSEWPENFDPEEEDNDDIPPTMSLPWDIFLKYKIESKVYQNINIKCDMIFSKFNLYERLWEIYLGEKFVFYSSPSIDVPKDYKNIFGDKSPDNYIKALTFIDAKRNDYCNFYFEKIMQISFLIEYLNKTSNVDKKIKYMKILIYLNYLLCWLYVLIISLPSLDTEQLFIVLEQTYMLIEEPFSFYYITNEFLYL